MDPDHKIEHEKKKAHKRYRLWKWIEELDKKLNKNFTITIHTNIAKAYGFFMTVPSIYADHVTTLYSIYELWSSG